MKEGRRVPVMAQQKWIWLVSVRMWVRSLGLAQWVKHPGINSIYGSNPMLLWLWSRPAAAALIRPLPWEPPYATGSALKTKRKERKRERKEGSKRQAWCWEETPGTAPKLQVLTGSEPHTLLPYTCHSTQRTWVWGRTFMAPKQVLW